jgi:hypothetical protein
LLYFKITKEQGGKAFDAGREKLIFSQPQHLPSSTDIWNPPIVQDVAIIAVGVFMIILVFVLKHSARKWDKIAKIYSFLKNPKVLSVAVFFLLIVVTQLRWEYKIGTFVTFEGSRSITVGNYKVDRLTGFRYYNKKEGGEYPLYNTREQPELYNMAKAANNIETAIIKGSFVVNFIWLLYAYIVKPIEDVIKSFKDSNKT